ncbi:MAG: molybdate ABC transporter substrate-binding protein [Planctomycetota bacterium]
MRRRARQRPKKNPRPKWAASLLAGILAAGLSSCDDENASVVFAAASLRAPLEEAITAFEAEHPDAEIRLHLAGSSTLALQILQGAPAGLFLSADEPWIRRVQQSGKTSAEPLPFVSNRICLAVQKGNPRRITGLSDWFRDDLRVGLCGPDVPAGRYARAVLAGAGVEPRSVSDEPDVHALATKVALGEIDVALLYRTDLTIHDLEEVGIGADGDVGIRYWLALLGEHSPQENDSLSAFVDFLRSATGLALLQSHGFAL